MTGAALAFVPREQQAGAAAVIDAALAHVHDNFSYDAGVHGFDGCVGAGQRFPGLFERTVPRKGFKAGVGGAKCPKGVKGQQGGRDSLCRVCEDGAQARGEILGHEGVAFGAGMHQVGGESSEM